MEKKDKNKKLAILVATLLLVIGVSFAYWTGVSDTKGNGEVAEGNITIVKGAELNVQGKLEFNDIGILPGHKNVSSVKVTATGNNELIPYNLIWNGTNNLNTPLNFTVYKTSEEVEVQSTCQKKNKVENGLSYLSEECTISNLEELGSSIAESTIDTSEAETKVTLAKDEFITAISNGQVVYYYIILEYPNLEESQNTDMGKGFDGVISVEENDSVADLSITEIYVKQEDENYKEVEDIPSQGYMLNANKSICTNDATLKWNNNKLRISQFSKQGTQCKLYFDKLVNAKDTILTNNAVNIEPPNFSKTSCSNGCDENTVGIYLAEDNDGTSYYYRGDVTNNYLKFGKHGSDIYFGYYDTTTNTNFMQYASLTECQTASSYNKNCKLGIEKGTDMWWRIIRINGDGTIRIIYDGNSYHENGSSVCDSIAITNVAFNLAFNPGYKLTYNTHVGFMYGKNTGNLDDERANINKSNILEQLEIWYENNLQKFEGYIDINAGFCGDREIDYATTTDPKPGVGYNNTNYASFNRMWSNSIPTLKCSRYDDLYTISKANKGNDTLKYPIGLITGDEVQMAGGKKYSYQVSNKNEHYYLNNGQYYWTMTPFKYYDDNARVMHVSRSGELNDTVVTDKLDVRPVINLKSYIPITGSGTETDPFVVS